MTGLPKGWTIEPFERVARYDTGRTPARANAKYWDGKGDVVAWVAISDMEEFGTITSTAEAISELAFRDVFRERIVPAGTLLMSFKLTIGRIATLGIPACHNEAIISIYPRRGVNQRYLGYFLSQVDYSDHQDRQVKGHTLNQAKINRIPILLPPEHEQRTIADVLDRVQAGIHTERELEQTALALKHAAMRELFTRGLRDGSQKETDIGLVPESWSVLRLGQVCALSTGTTPATKDKHYYDGDIPFIKTADVINNRISAASTFVSQQAIDDYSLKIFPPGTVLMAMYGQGKTRGQVSLLEISAATTQNAAAIQPSSEIDSAFLWHYLMSCYERLRGMGSLGHVSHLNLGYLRDLLIVKPPLEEQRKIAAILDAIDRKIDLHKQKRAVLEDLFKSLLHKLMTGEISVSELDLSALPSASTQREEATA